MVFLLEQVTLLWDWPVFKTDLFCSPHRNWTVKENMLRIMKKCWSWHLLNIFLAPEVGVCVWQKSLQHLKRLNLGLQMAGGAAKDALQIWVILSQISAQLLAFFIQNGPAVLLLAVHFGSMKSSHWTTMLRNEC